MLITARQIMWKGLGYALKCCILGSTQMTARCRLKVRVLKLPVYDLVGWCDKPGTQSVLNPKT